MTSEKVPVVVIGAGVVGCAVAEALAARGLPSFVLEKGPRIAEGCTSRNSGVIHGGLYYKPGSLKAELCIEGNPLLYEWCRTHSVAHRKVGKWVVAGTDEEAELVALFENAKASGARGVSLHSFRTTQLPDGCQGEWGLFSPETGIVDPAELSFSLRNAAEENGAMFLTHARVESLSPAPSGGEGFLVESSRGPIETEMVINCAGLYSDEIAAMAGVRKYRIYPCRGDYFRLRAPTQFKQLVYPVKKKGAPGLGTHLTLALDGSCRLGPDAFYVNGKEEFSDPGSPDLENKAEAFFQSVSRFLTGIRRGDLSYDSCGIRPKLRGPADPEEVDFVIARDAPGLINLVGIESPGLTASLAIAHRVSKMF